MTDRKVVEEHGGVSTPDSKEKDKATEWLNQNSAGTGPYKLVGWVRNSQIQLVANPNYWGGKPPFQRVVVRHFEDGAAQLLALRRGDIDVAFNLLPEQVATLKDEKDVWVNGLDQPRLRLSGAQSQPGVQQGAGQQEARQAIGYAIDYEGIKNSLLGGAATRPANFIPVGCLGSTEEVTRQIGFREDLDRSRKLLTEAGYPDGFEFEVIYGTSIVAGTSYHVMGQKINPISHASASSSRSTRCPRSTCARSTTAAR